MKISKELSFSLFTLVFANIGYCIQGNQRQTVYKCERVRPSICTKVHERYNSTGFPNFRNNPTQEHALNELALFNPLIKTGCSADLARFLCSLYIPVCSSSINNIIPPCKELCLSSEKGCSPLMAKFGHKWPYNCTTFPKEGGDSVCIASNNKEEDAPKETKKEIVYGNRRVWQVIDENEKRHIGCEANTEILIRRVKHKDSKCCQKATKEVLSAVCNGKPVCIIKNSANFLGAHCAKGQGKLMIKFKCVKTGTYKSKCEQKPSV